MVNAERPPFERESRDDSVFWEFDSIRHIFFRDEHEFCDTLNDTTLAIALIGAGDDFYIPVLHGCMSIDRRERILAIISQSHDVTEEEIEAAQRLICDEACKFDRAYYLKKHIFSWYDVNELGDIECLTIPDGILEIDSEPFSSYTDEKNYNLVAEERIFGWWDHTIQPGIQTVVLPESLKRIGNMAFRNMVCLENIHFGNSLEHIGEDAFESCGLKKIELPGSVKDIGESAFEHCHHLRSVKLSEGIEVIPKEMFFHCTSLREVILPSTIKEIGKHAFYDCYNLERIDLPEGLTVIAEGLFSGCISMKEIYIPKSVTQIEDDAFGDGWEGGSCEKDLVVACHQDSFAHQYAIENNLKFKLVTLNRGRPAFIKRSYSVSVYGGFDHIFGAFCDLESEFCETLDDATLAIALIGAEDDIYDAIYWRMSIDQRKRILAIISQSHDVTEKDMEAAQLQICEAAFKYKREYYSENHIFSWFDAYELGDIECLTIPDGTLEIEDKAFEGYKWEMDYRAFERAFASGRCGHLRIPGFQTVVFPSSLKRIEDYAFSNMLSLKNIQFGNSLEHIGEYAFCCCGLEKIELPGSIKDIGKKAFMSCICLESVKLSEGIEVIPEEMFYYCCNLREVILPSTIKDIGDNAFRDCHGLEKISLPEGLTVIAKGLFQGCGSMKEIYIPKSVTQIEDNAFGRGWYGGCEENLVITCHQDSFAHQYAIENNLKFNLANV